MYEGDSFFTLSSGGRAGLVLISCLLAAGLGAVARYARWRFSSSLAGALAGLGLFWLFLWLSPQVYYAYYRTLFDGLPAQWVIKSPPGPERVATTLVFSDRPTFAAHSAGLLGWSLVMAGAWPIAGRRNAASRPRRSGA